MLASTDRNSFRLALTDLWEGLSSLHLWPMLGWLEIRQRYRRSILGPFWLTLSTGVLIGAMGPLYGRLLGQDLAGYFPYLAISLILWQFISGMINESCVAFVAAESYIKQTRLPLTVHVLRVVWRNLIIFAHNVVIVVLVLLFYPPTIGWELLTVPLGCLLVAVNGVWFGILLGLLSARFRDIPQSHPLEEGDGGTVLLERRRQPHLPLPRDRPRTAHRTAGDGHHLADRCFDNGRRLCRGPRPVQPVPQPDSVLGIET